MHEQKWDGLGPFARRVAQEVEVGSFRSLEDALEEERAVASPVRRLGRRPGSAPPLELDGSMSRSSRFSSTSSTIGSPVSTSAIGPPTADSGATCTTSVPNEVPLIRESEMRTIW